MGIVSALRKSLSNLRRVKTPSYNYSFTKHYPDGLKTVSSFYQASNITRTASKAILTWGNAAKGALVAAGGVIAYRWFGSGIPSFFAQTFGTDEETGSWIAIACFILLFAAVLTYIFRRVSNSEHHRIRYRGKRGYRR